jgi:molecular chaperone DnaK
VELTRERLDELTEDLLERVVDATRRTIEIARGRGAGQLDDVLLVGGMTRAPAVSRILKDRLGLDARHHEPDLAVAKGAARYALMRTARGPDGLADVAAMTGMTVP